jgi:hypothetical protein
VQAERNTKRKQCFQFLFPRRSLSWTTPKCASREKKKEVYLFFLPKRSLFYQKIVQTEVIEKKEALHHEVPLNALSFKVAYL